MECFQVCLKVWKIRNIGCACCTDRQKGVTSTNVGVVIHDQQVLGAPLRARPLISSHKAGDVVVLQQRQPVDRAFIEEVLAVVGGENLDGDRSLVEGAAIDGAVSTPANQLQGEGKWKESRKKIILTRLTEYK